MQEFEFNLEESLFRIQEELKLRTYEHSTYSPFYIQDPKLRHIHKACVKDRVVHQAIFRILYPIFDKGFIFDSYSCRFEKGVHKAVNRLETFARKLSKNYTKAILVLKCDIRKFFDSIDHTILIDILEEKVGDISALFLIQRIIESFEKEKRKGLPLGNVTSQLFANVYLNELDQFVKHVLKIKYYIRYCDDFVILSENREYLNNLIVYLREFLVEKLKLRLHEKKIVIRKHSQGIDFLGYVALPHYRILRTKTKRRILRKIMKKKKDFESGIINHNSLNQSVQSYFGVLKHCKGFKTKEVIKNDIINK